MNKKIFPLFVLVFCTIFSSCNSKHPASIAVKVFVLNPEKDSLDIYIDNDLARSFTETIGDVYLTEGVFDISIEKEGEKLNEMELEISSEQADYSTYFSERVTLVNANSKSNYVLINCLAAYEVMGETEFKVEEKFINQSVIELEVKYQNFRFEWQSLPENISGYEGVPTIYKLFSISEKDINKSDDEIIIYCLENGLLD